MKPFKNYCFSTRIGTNSVEHSQSQFPNRLLGSAQQRNWLFCSHRSVHIPIACVAAKLNNSGLWLPNALLFLLLFYVLSCPFPSNCASFLYHSSSALFLYSRSVFQSEKWGHVKETRSSPGSIKKWVRGGTEKKRVRDRRLSAIDALTCSCSPGSAWASSPPGSSSPTGLFYQLLPPPVNLSPACVISAAAILTLPSFELDELTDIISWKRWNLLETETESRNDDAPVQPTTNCSYSKKSSSFLILTRSSIAELLKDGNCAFCTLQSQIFVVYLFLRLVLWNRIVPDWSSEYLCFRILVIGNYIVSFRMRNIKRASPNAKMDVRVVSWYNFRLWLT